MFARFKQAKFKINCLLLQNLSHISKFNFSLWNQVKYV